MRAGAEAARDARGLRSHYDLPQSLSALAQRVAAIDASSTPVAPPSTAVGDVQATNCDARSALLRRGMRSAFARRLASLVQRSFGDRTVDKMQEIEVDDASVSSASRRGAVAAAVVARRRRVRRRRRTATAIRAPSAARRRRRRPTAAVVAPTQGRGVALPGPGDHGPDRGRDRSPVDDARTPTWFDEQFAKPQTLHRLYINQAAADAAAVGAADQRTSTSSTRGGARRSAARTSCASAWPLRSRRSSSISFADATLRRPAARRGRRTTTCWPRRRSATSASCSRA